MLLKMVQQQQHSDGTIDDLLMEQVSYPCALHKLLGFVLTN